MKTFIAAVSFAALAQVLAYADDSYVSRAEQTADTRITGETGNYKLVIPKQ